MIGRVMDMVMIDRGKKDMVMIAGGRKDIIMVMIGKTLNSYVCPAEYGSKG